MRLTETPQKAEGPDLIPTSDKISSDINTKSNRSYKATALDESANSSAEQPIKGGSPSSDGKVNTLSSDKQEISTESSAAEAKKRALDTVVGSKERHSTVVSSADGAKVINNLETLANHYQQKENGKEKSFIGRISEALGLHNNGNHSNYGTFEGYGSGGLAGAATETAAYDRDGVRIDGAEKLSEVQRRNLESYLDHYSSAPIHVIKDMADVDSLDFSEEDRQEFRNAIATGDIPAVYCSLDGKVYIFADRFDIADHGTVLLHENIHALVDRLGGLSDELGSLRENIL